MIFEDDDSLESWVEDTIDNGSNYDDIMVLHYQSDFKPKKILRDEILASEVIKLVAVATDVMAVLIKLKEATEC